MTTWATILLSCALPAAAADKEQEAQVAELDRVRAQVADQIHLAAFDLLDELVYGWTVEAPFETPTPVVLASVTVPVGLGTGLQALLENHLSAVLAQNPTTNLQLVHCPTCTAVVVHSGPEGTIVSRGIDDPTVLAELGTATGRHALFVDVEAEGAWLVLRARLTKLTPELPIVWSHTLATSASTPALLRQPDDLKSAAAARDEYLDALHDRGVLAVPVRLAIRSYARPQQSYYYSYNYTYTEPYTSPYSSVSSASARTSGGTTGGQGVPPPPFLWLQTGLELSPTDARVWTTSLIVGYSFIPEAYQGVMAQARVNRLVTGRARSSTRPDLYLFVGGAVTSVWGPATASFQRDVPNLDEILAAVEGEGPRTSFGGVQAGADLRVGNRIGVAMYLETLPDLADSANIGNYLRFWSLGFQSLGTEVTFWF